MLRIIPFWLITLVFLASCTHGSLWDGKKDATDSLNSSATWGKVFRSDGEFAIHRQKWWSPVVLDVEIPNTPEEMIEWLMYRSPLSSEQGMLFVYRQPIPVNFWMKNVSFPLDILFFDSTWKLVQIYEHTVPYSTTYLPSHLPIQYVLEVPAGTIRKHSIYLGDIGKEVSYTWMDIPMDNTLR
jgi:uncharacterized protein